MKNSAMNSSVKKCMVGGLVVGVGLLYSVLAKDAPELIHRHQSVEKKQVVQTHGKKIKTKSIAVHIAGAVYQPGVYQLSKGARVVDVIQIAGGVLPGAHYDTLNLAKIVKDEQRLYVPFSEKEREENTAHRDGININTASQTQLEALPKIGPVTARAIIQFRAEHGPFASVGQLIKVKGIGVKTLKRLEAFLQCW
ncbi:hypothetical protein DID78_04815 [Candidatus Marinamargulisbacteria bacterium SCGC AG-343-D04]|nr:hypothetical protein DID78_04815 [Candidatus Marinamargulisbacteria bacterium SCGC AG-343-D04]